MIRFCLPLLFLFFAGTGFSQNYTILGNASSSGGCNCFRLTPDDNDQGGAIYQNKTINLSNSFDFTFSVFLGCNNGNGAADGIVFVLTSNPNGLGQRGEYLGYGNGSNQPFSLAVEFDTWSNGNHGDPSYDHIAIESSGSVDHNVTPYVPALPGGGNIDNCQWYTVRIVWDVNTGTFSVYFNGALVQQIINPYLVNNYFNGNPIVNWGWSGATGGGTNDQQVCILNTSSWVAGINYQSCDLTIPFSDISTSSLGSVQSWAWDFGDGGTSSLQNPSHTFLTAGTYSVTLVITDISGCTNTFTHDVFINPPITLMDTLIQPLCNGGSNGSILIGASGGFGASAGLGGYTYTWNGGAAFTRPYQGIPAGTYSVVVTDGVCTTTATYTLNQPPPLVANTSHTDATCVNNDGTASITLSGGTPPYTPVNWGAGGIGNTVTGLAMGVYVPDFHDFNGCSALLQYREIVNSLPCGIASSTSSTDVSCFGLSNGTATATVTGGGLNPTITWSNNMVGPAITGLAAGTYTFTYTDNVPANTFTGSVTVNEPGAAMVATMTTINMSCDNTNDGQALASVTSGGVSPFNYAWSRGQPNPLSPSATNLTPGAISVVITDNNGCTATASGIITGPPTLTINVTSTPDSCYHSKKGTATATAGGGNPPYTYYWYNISSAETNLDLGVGTYNVTVSDSKGCTITGSATITEPDTFTHTLTSQNIDCFGNNNGSISIVSTGGTLSYTYLWNPATAVGNNPAGLVAGQYNLTLTDANNCKILDSVVIIEPASALNVTSSHTDASCNGAGASNGSITLNISGGTAPYNYLGNPIDSGITVVTNLPPNIYSGNVVDSSGCSVAVSETITGPGPQTLTVNNSNEPCNGSSTATANATFNNPNPPGTDSYAWTGGLSGSNITGLTAGVYVVTATDGNGCALVDSVTITEPPAQVLNVAVVNALCFGESGTATADSLGAGLITYSWSSGGNTRTVSLPAGDYTVTATDANSCNQISPLFSITQPDSIAVAETHESPTCFGNANGYIILSVSGGTTPSAYTYSWSPNISTTTSALNIPAGTFSITITDANACTVTQTFILTDAAALTISSTPGNVSCYGLSDGSITAAATGGTLPYNFSASATGGNIINSTTGVFNDLAVGDYNITVTDSNGCAATGTQTITQPDSVIIDVIPNTVEVPFGQSLQITTTTNQSGTLHFSWTPASGLSCYDCTNPQFIGDESQIYILEVSTQAGCAGEALIDVTVLPNYGIFIPNVFTPNDDTQNDFWQIFGDRATIKSLQAKIFDRWGNKIFESNDLNFKWDGIYKGKKVNPGVYVYWVNVAWLSNRPESHYKGSLTVLD